ncbi:hypothetical protein Tco_0983718 [Tanacetum coccineum]
MAQKRTAATTTTPVTDAQLKALIAQGVADALEKCDAYRIMNGKYCPRGEIKKLEIEMMFPEESDKIEKYADSLPNMIHESLMASKPKVMQDAIEFATELMDKNINTLAERVAIAYTAMPGEKKKYAGTLPLCKKWKFHHNGQCTVKCANWHYRSDCPELKNQNHGNQAGGTRAHGMVYALGRGEINQDLNNMEDDINAKTLFPLRILVKSSSCLGLLCALLTSHVVIYKALAIVCKLMDLVILGQYLDKSWTKNPRFIPQHEVVQKYSAILPDNLTTQAMKESEAYKTYYAFATRKAIPKPKYIRRSTKEKIEQAPKASSCKRLKATAKMKLAIERSKTQLHSSQPSGSGTHDGTGFSLGVPDVPKYGSDEEQISWKSSDEEDNDDEANIGKDEDDDDNADSDDDDERTEFDNDCDDYVHPKLSTHDEEDKHDEEDREEDSFDPKVQTSSHVESTDDEDSDEEIQGANVEGVEQDEEETNEEDEGHDLYRDVNVNLEGRDIEMTDAQQTNVQPT